MLLVLLCWLSLTSDASSWEDVSRDLTICNEESCRCYTFTRIICNCTNDYDEITFRSDGAYRIESSATALIVDGCARVFFMEESISKLHGLRRVELYNVKHVYFRQRSLSWAPYSKELELSKPGLKIIIKNSTINEMASQTFRGRIDEIIINNCRINMLGSFAFSSLVGMQSIYLFNNQYDNIEPHAFKQFSTSRLAMVHGKINNIPSRTFTDVEVTNTLRIESLDVVSISSSAFLIESPRKVLIQNNSIDTLDGDSFRIKTRGPVTFRNNIVNEVIKGAFFGFSVSNEILFTEGRQDLSLENNEIRVIDPHSLMTNTTSFNLKITALTIRQNCDCAMLDKWQNFAMAEDALWCYEEVSGQSTALSTFVSENCSQLKKNTWIYVVVAVIAVVVIVIAIALLVIKRENKKKHKLQIVMPDGKTYRETELHIVVERAELLTTDL